MQAFIFCIFHLCLVWVREEFCSCRVSERWLNECLVCRFWVDRNFQSRKSVNSQVQFLLRKAVYAGLH